MLCDGRIKKDGAYLKLRTPADGAVFQEDQFSEACLGVFQLIVITRLPQVPPEFVEHMHLVTVA